MGSKKNFFASDFHLGLDMSFQSSIKREALIIEWLDSISDEAGELYLLGDIFDYWFEYKSGIPKGFDKFLAKIMELREAGIPISFFTGNHDLWMKSYFENEYGITIYRSPITKEISGKKFHMGHGDGLGPGDHTYKMMKKVFTNPTCQWIFSLVPPSVGLGMMKSISKRSREKYEDVDDFLGDNEWLIQYIKGHVEIDKIDYYLFGHRHLTIDHQLKNKSARYINLGEWITSRSYVVFDGQEPRIEFFKNPDGKIYG